MASDGRCDTEIRKRIVMSKDYFTKIYITSTEIIIIGNLYVVCFLNGCEFWAMIRVKKYWRKQALFFYFRKMLKVLWTEKKTNAGY